MASRLRQNGLAEPCEGSRTPRIVPLELLAAQPDDGTPLVALFDGIIGAAHAELMRAPRPPLLLACRENGQPSGWELRALAVCLCEAPLMMIAPVVSQAWRICAVPDLRAIAHQAETMVRDSGAGAAAAAIVADVMYELAANALFDAPHTPDGTPKYAHRRGAEVEIDPADACRATVAVSDGRAYLSATDLFGRMTAAPIAAVIAGLGAKAQVNAAGGGAGLGLRRVIEQSDLWAVRVSPSLITEVLCVVDLGDTRRRVGRPKSLLFTALAKQ